jgi:hypothetical protein
VRKFHAHIRKDVSSIAVEHDFQIPPSDPQTANPYSLPVFAAAPKGVKLMLDVRPEHFTTNGNVAVLGNVSLAETQGRENLYGSMAAPAALDLTSSP